MTALTVMFRFIRSRLLCLWTNTSFASYCFNWFPMQSKRLIYLLFPILKCWLPLFVQMKLWSFRWRTMGVAVLNPINRRLERGSFRVGRVTKQEADWG